MKKFMVVLIFLFTISIATASLLVEPTKLEFVLDPLSKATEAIRITNVSTAPLLITASAYDWILDENGDLLNRSLGTHATTLSGNIKFNPKQFTLNPGQTQIVRVTITMPDNAPLERRSIIFFETEQVSGSNHIKTVFQTLIGATVYATSTNATSSYEILAFEHTTDDVNGLVLHLLTENTGETHVRLNFEYNVSDLGDQVLYSNAVYDTVILPEHHHIFHLPVTEDLVPGVYKFNGRVTFDGTVNFLPFTFQFIIE